MNKTQTTHVETLCILVWIIPLQWMLQCGEMSDYKINWYRMTTNLCKHKLITQLLKLDISPTLKNVSNI